jgi:hypothetical protein
VHDQEDVHRVSQLIRHCLTVVRAQLWLWFLSVYQTDDVPSLDGVVWKCTASIVPVGDRSLPHIQHHETVVTRRYTDAGSLALASTKIDMEFTMRSLLTNQNGGSR